jgi:hypothetical protein
MMLINSAVFDQNTFSVAEQKLYDACDGVDQNRTRSLSESDLSKFEQLVAMVALADLQL